MAQNSIATETTGSGDVLRKGATTLTSVNYDLTSASNGGPHNSDEALGLMRDAKSAWSEAGYKARRNQTNPDLNGVNKGDVRYTVHQHQPVSFNSGPLNGQNNVAGFVFQAATIAQPETVVLRLFVPFASVDNINVAAFSVAQLTP